MTFKILILVSLKFACSWSKPLAPLDPTKSIGSPWQLSLWMDRSDVCGAVLIASPNMTGQSDMALTDAHCLIGGGFEPIVFRFKAHTYRVVAGNHSLRTEVSFGKNLDGEVVEKVIDAVYHPDWINQSADLTGDLAVIRLAKPIKYSKTIQPIPLPEKDAVMPSDCYVAAYGGYLKYQLREYSIYAEKDDCKSNGFGGAVPERMICDILQYYSKGLRDGDSGGPFVCPKDGQHTLYGIASMTVQGSGPVADIYTRVSCFIDWINEKISKPNYWGSN